MFLWKIAALSPYFTRYDNDGAAVLSKCGNGNTILPFITGIGISYINTAFAYFAFSVYSIDLLFTNEIYLKLTEKTCLSFDI